ETAPSAAIASRGSTCSRISSASKARACASATGSFASPSGERSSGTRMRRTVDTANRARAEWGGSRGYSNRKGEEWATARAEKPLNPPPGYFNVPGHRAVGCRLLLWYDALAASTLYEAAHEVPRAPPPDHPLPPPLRAGARRRPRRRLGRARVSRQGAGRDADRGADAAADPREVADRSDGAPTAPARTVAAEPPADERLRRPGRRERRRHGAAVELLQGRRGPGAGAHPGHRPALRRAGVDRRDRGRSVGPAATAGRGGDRARRRFCARPRARAAEVRPLLD